MTAHTPARPPDRRPNILLVMTDQHRGDCLGVAGHPGLLTPNLDGLAHRGAYFPHAYSECPICIPARHAVMTGKSPQTTGLTGFAHRARIADEENTLPNLLRNAGYQTAAVGRSMHTYPHYRRYGFETVDLNQDHFYREHPHRQPLSDSGGIWSDWPHLHDHGLGANTITARPWHLPEAEHETNQSIRKAIRFLDRRDRESPFFLYVGTVAPHPPLLPPEPYYRRYDHDDLPAPAVGEWVDQPGCALHCPPLTEPPTAADTARLVLRGPQLRSTRAGYLGLINHFDDQLQLLLTRLLTEGLDRNTYIVFTSDHGEMLGDHHCFRKSLPYEGSARIPFLLAGPGISSHRVVTEPVVLMDILPTCCAIAGVQPPPGIEGKNLLPAIRGETLGRAWVHGTHGEMAHLHDGFHYLTDGRWKYIWWTRSGCEQLFHLAEDPQELHELSGEASHASQLEAMRSALIERLADAPEGFVRNGRLVAGLKYGSYNERASVDP